jgi:hypothetical protein
VGGGGEEVNAFLTVSLYFIFLIISILIKFLVCSLIHLKVLLLTNKYPCLADMSGMEVDSPYV